MANEETTPAPDKNGTATRTTSRHPGIGYGVLILALVAMGVSLWQAQNIRSATERDSRVTACQAKYNEAFAVNIKVRALLSDEDREAQHDFQKASAGFANQIASLINTAFSIPPGTPQDQQVKIFKLAYGNFRIGYTEFTLAQKQYDKREAAIDAARRAHPLPQLPSKACA